MTRTKIIYQSKEEIHGKHMRSGEWIYVILVTSQFMIGKPVQLF
jgi:hypothetical protein